MNGAFPLVLSIGNGIIDEEITSSTSVRCIDYRCAQMVDFRHIFDFRCPRGVTLMKSRSVSSSETCVRNGNNSWKSGKHNYFHQLNDRSYWWSLIQQ